MIRNKIKLISSIWNMEKKILIHSSTKISKLLKFLFICNQFSSTWLKFLPLPRWKSDKGNKTNWKNWSKRQKQRKYWGRYMRLISLSWGDFTETKILAQIVFQPNLIEPLKDKSIGKCLVAFGFTSKNVVFTFQRK